MSRANGRAWLQLFRAPNLLTVPGDPLCGFLLASGGAISPVVIAPIFASLCFYAAGLALNDVCDLDEDRSERPNRPLPSGRIPLRHAWIAIIALTILGLAAMTIAAGWRGFIFSTATIGAIALYDTSAKHLVGLGEVIMGACRGLSCLLGAVAAAPWPLSERSMTAALLIGLYIAGVTGLARFETSNRIPRFRFLVCGFLLVFVCFKTLRAKPMSLVLLAIAMAVLFIAFRQLLRPGAPIPPVIGLLIRTLLIFQAMFCFASGSLTGALCGLALVALWPASAVLSRRFYAS